MTVSNVKPVVELSVVGGMLCYAALFAKLAQAVHTLSPHRPVASDRHCGYMYEPRSLSRLGDHFQQRVSISNLVKYVKGQIRYRKRNRNR